jgi:lipopolysaccharide transport system permease protein
MEMNVKKSEEWTLEIKPKSNLFDFHLRQLWEYRDLLILLVRRDIITVYKQTLLGFFWFVLPPILNTITYFIIFGLIAKVSTDGMNPILFYLSGVISWGYFADCINRTSTTFRTNASIFGKVYFPRLIVPISSIASALIKFAIQIILLIIVTAYFYFKENNVSPQFQYIWLLPIIIGLMAFSGLAIGIIISSLTTKYRDLSNLVPFAVSILMYATPVIYPSSIIPSQYKWIIQINPLTPLIESFRFIFLGSDQISWWQLLYCLIFTTILFVIGLVLFNKTEKTFMDTV